MLTRHERLPEEVTMRMHVDMHKMFEKSLGLSSGLGFLIIVVLIGLLTSIFILWSMSCLGGLAVDLLGRMS